MLEENKIFSDLRVEIKEYQTLCSSKGYQQIKAMRKKIKLL